MVVMLPASLFPAIAAMNSNDLTPRQVRPQKLGYDDRQGFEAHVIEQHVGDGRPHDVENVAADLTPAVRELVERIIDRLLDHLSGKQHMSGGQHSNLSRTRTVTTEEALCNDANI